MEIFIMLEKPDEKFVRDFRALRIARLSATGEVLGSVSWGATSLPEGAKLWLLGSCSGARIPDARWLELSRNVSDGDLV